MSKQLVIRKQDKVINFNEKCTPELSLLLPVSHDYYDNHPCESSLEDCSISRLLFLVNENSDLIVQIETAKKILSEQQQMNRDLLKNIKKEKMKVVAWGKQTHVSITQSQPSHNSYLLNSAGEANQYPRTMGIQLSHKSQEKISCKDLRTRDFSEKSRVRKMRNNSCGIQLCRSPLKRCLF